MRRRCRAGGVRRKARAAGCRRWEGGGWVDLDRGEARRGAARRRVAVDRAPKIGEEICELVGGVRWWQAEQTRSTDGLRAGP
jgi:hypothetical protein